MRSLKYLFLMTLALSIETASIYGIEADGKTDFQQELEESTDEEELLSFINSKRNIPLADKSKYLSISGEVHTEWNNQNERIDGKKVRIYTFREIEDWNDDIFERGDTIAIGPNDFDIQVDFFMDWKTDRTWARTHLRYDNSSGVSDNGLDETLDPTGYHGSGSVDNLALREAYVGYEVFKKGSDRLTLEIGRRGNIYRAFYSEIQFGSRLDAIILKYCSSRGGFGDWYVQAAGFIVDERATHYAWLAEIGINNIMNSGFDAKYSFIDWQLYGRNRFFVKNPIGFRFKVSQWSLLYCFNPAFLKGRPIKLAGGFLMNHIPARFTFVDEFPDRVKYTPKRVRIGRQNLGAFVNFQINEIHHEGDWFISGLVGFCEAQCIPDNDVRNIGTGNFLHDSMTSDGRGNTNWKGYFFKVGYAITENLVIESEYVHSWQILNIAGTQSYNRYTLGTTYCSKLACLN